MNFLGLTVELERVDDEIDSVDAEVMEEDWRRFVLSSQYDECCKLIYSYPKDESGVVVRTVAHDEWAVFKAGWQMARDRSRG